MRSAGSLAPLKVLSRAPCERSRQSGPQLVWLPKPGSSWLVAARSLAPYLGFLAVSLAAPRSVDIHQRRASETASGARPGSNESGREWHRVGCLCCTGRKAARNTELYMKNRRDSIGPAARPPESRYYRSSSSVLAGCDMNSTASLFQTEANPNRGETLFFIQGVQLM
jgi:hypothetical protein